MDCDSLAYVSFYGAVEEYPKDSFKNCPNLIRTGGTAAAFAGLKRIGESAYEGCSSLTASSSWNLGRYANLEEIGDFAFKGCSTLADSTLSATVIKLGNNIFDGCTSLNCLTLQSLTTPQIGLISPDKMAEGFLILVPDSQESGDSVYLAYREQLSNLIGEERAYQILDSVSDGAKERNPLPEKATEPNPVSEEHEDTESDGEDKLKDSKKSERAEKEETEKEEKKEEVEEETTEKSEGNQTEEQGEQRDDNRAVRTGNTGN